MSLEEINQNSFDWLEWRKKGIGSSDVAAILNVSPYLTAFKLWEIKTGKKENEVSNYATERGHRLEPKARAAYELINGIEMPPTLVEHDQYTFMRASLDGWNKEQARILEIKCPGKEVMDLAKEGKIPDHYQAQIQYQLYLTDATVCDYFCFDGEAGVNVEILPDKKAQVEIVSAIRNFWAYVETKMPPPLSDKDFKAIDDMEVKTNLFRWKDTIRAIKKLQDTEKALRASIIKGLDHPRSEACGVKITEVTRKGSIDTLLMAEKGGLNVEDFRKESTISYQFRIEASDDSTK